MESARKELQRLLSVINCILGFVGQDLNVKNLHRKRKRPDAVYVATVLMSVLYSGYLVRCLLRMKDFTAISDVIWLVPLILQYSTMTINVLLHYEEALEFIQWTLDLFSKSYSVDFIQTRVKLCNELCMKRAKFVFGSALILVHCPGLLYIGDWLFTDKMLFTNISDRDEDISFKTYLINVFMQLANGWLVVNIMNGYNLFLYLGAFVLVYRRRTISRMLMDLKVAKESSEWRRNILIECHLMNVEVVHWTHHLQKYYDFVGLVVISTFIVTECFVLYLFTHLSTSTGIATLVAVFVGGLFIVFVPCAFGEWIALEADRIRSCYYNLNWEDFNLQDRKLIYTLMLLNTPETVFSVGQIFELNMRNFAKFVKMCFSLYALLKAL